MAYLEQACNLMTAWGFCLSRILRTPHTVGQQDLIDHGPTRVLLGCNRMSRQPAFQLRWVHLCSS